MASTFSRSSWAKLICFGLAGALGGLLLALSLGELSLWLTRRPPQIVKTPIKIEHKVETIIPTSVCLLIDSSGSMQGARIHEVKGAAKNFVNQNDFKNLKVALVAFASDAALKVPLTDDPIALNRGIDGLNANGGTRMDLGLQKARDVLQGAVGNRYILLFTDGIPDSKDSTTTRAAEVRRQGIEIVAIGTAGAELSFLAQLSNDPKHAFWASAGQFQVEFQKASKIVTDVEIRTETKYTEQLVERVEPGYYTPLEKVLRPGLWTAMLALGIALALILAQNHYLGRSLLHWVEGIKGIGGALLAGLCAGAAGQVLYQLTVGDSANVVMNSLSRGLGWVILGGLLGVGMAFFIPNLDRIRALIGGALGGLLAVSGFLLASAGLGDFAGRLLGAAALGLCIGLMVAIVELVFRKMWLEVHYGPGEVRTINLGAEPVHVGGDARRCSIFVRQAPRRAFSYVLKNGKIECLDVLKEQYFPVGPGHRQQVGNVAILVCGGDALPRHTPGPNQPVAMPSPVRNPDGVPSNIVNVTWDALGTWQLHLSSGKAFPLKLGTKLTARELPGLETQRPDGVTAEVTSHPMRPKDMGLTNHSRQIWAATLASGENRYIEPGKTLKLDPLTRINFGSIQGEFREPAGTS